MHLQNINVRTRKTLIGWIVEVEKEKRHFLFFKKKYWVPIIMYDGMPNVPFHYSTKNVAIIEAVRLFKWDLIESSKHLDEKDFSLKQ